MARSGFEDIELRNFSGLDLRGPGEMISDRSLQICNNFEVGDVGQLKTRPGFRQVYNGAAFNVPIRFLGQYSFDTTNQIFVLTVLNNYSATGDYHGFGKVFMTSDGGATWTQVSTPVGTNYAVGRGSQYGAVIPPTIYFPSTSGLIGWNGTAWFGPIATATGSSYDSLIAQERFFEIEDTTESLWASKPAAFETRDIQIQFNVQNRDRIVGILPYRDRIVVFFTNSIRVLNIAGPPSTWTLKFLSYYLGVNTQDCYYVHNDLIYFLSYDGFYRTDLSQLEELSKPIAPVMQSRYEAYQNQSSLFFKYRDAISYWRGRFIISMRTVKGSPIPTHRMFMYNVRNGAWSEIVPAINNVDGLGFTPFTSFQPIFVGRRIVTTTPYNKEGLYCIGGDPSGRVYIFDDEDPVFMDAVNSNYLASFKTKFVDADLPMEWKRSHRVGIRMKSDVNTSVVTTLNVNGADRTPVFTPVTTSSNHVRIKGPGYFRKMSLECRDNGNIQLEIEGVTVSVKKKSDLSETTT